MNGLTKKEREKQKQERLGMEKVNKQGCLMKVIEYNGCMDIIVEFQDEYKYKINTRWDHFKDGNIKNPYAPSTYNTGIIGTKYPISEKINNKNKSTKEYKLWQRVLERCYNDKYKEKYPIYKDATCCKEWLYFPNFYEWVHSQENFEKWLNGERWAIDKDILIKGNKIYSPETCCLVPQNVNSLFTKANSIRGDYPIGVHWHSANQKFCAKCRNPFINEEEIIGEYNDPIKAFYAYKKYKEKLIKQVAEDEYSNGNIIKSCYDSMMSYKVEITD